MNSVNMKQIGKCRYFKTNVSEKNVNVKIYFHLSVLMEGIYELHLQSYLIKGTVEFPSVMFSSTFN